VQKSDKIWMDGEFVPWDAANVHVLTHTLHYGLGVFEGIRCYEGDDGIGRVFRLPEHVDRLFGSAHILGIEIPFSFDDVLNACVATVRENGLRSCYIRPLVFLGDGEMGLAARSNRVRVAIAVWPWGAYLGDEGIQRGVRLQTSSYQRIHVNSLMTKSKTVGNYVNSILASLEAKRAGCDEAMMLDSQGFVAECSGENLFIARGGRVRTSPATAILPGITRDTILRLLADAGVSASENAFTRDETYLADEVFMTGTAAEVTPVREIDGRRIGAGEPGPITRELQRQYAAITRAQVPAYEGWLTPVVP
jgi:branched-chain amino acid aminotransferase